MTNEQLTKLSADIANFADDTRDGKPRYQALVANIAAFEPVTLTDLWREESDLPSDEIETYWELWYHDDNGLETSSYPLLDRFGAQLDLTVEHPVLQLGEYISCVVVGTKHSVEMLLNTRAMPVEIRRPSFMEELETLGQDFVEDWVQDFAGLVDPAPLDAPVVTVLDNGVKASHPLLSPSLRERVWSVIDGHPGDDMFSRHGIQMAGVALFGDLRDHLDIKNGERLELTHGLGAVRVLRRKNDVHESHHTPGILMVNAVAEAEIRRPKNRRVFLLAQTMTNRSGTEHRQALPTTWSTALDALAMGCMVEVGSEKVKVGQPEPGAQRLFCVSIGNVRNEDFDALGLPSAFPSTNMTKIAEDPSQAWNVLRIGAYTELDEVPSSAHYEGWQPLSVKGGLSPHSRTGVLANKNHGAVPDIVLEGGNLLRSPSGALDYPSAVSVITTSTDSAAPLTPTFATSSGTAQAARLAAIIQSRYPDYRPETVRGLMVHRAEWTEHMAAGIHGPRNGTTLTKGVFDKTILRMYGWGVPREKHLLNSEASDVTMVVQDRLKPFDGQRDPKLGEVKFYKLPWSRNIIEQLGSSPVELRVTLSYFVEPNPGKRGANHHSTYPSHGLQFLIKSGTQSSDEFRKDIAEAEDDDDKSGAQMFSAGSGWVAGTKNRDRGSLRSDMWRGAAYKLLDVDEVAVVPLTGWWKLHRRTDRCALDVPYSLIVTLRTLGAEVDLYSNISNGLGLAIPPSLEVELPSGQLLLDL
ncbi:S8 family peptidase [Arthrobacter methylotrophus]|uniref:S8 family peptidase n=2 Tax=Arthrobacter methylotrophus TaxID=121291 RepID=UPI00366DBC68